MAANSQFTDEQHTDQSHLLQLLADVISLRTQLQFNAKQRLKHFQDYYPSEEFTPSATNLAHFLALKSCDCQSLQTRLTQVGLASLSQTPSAELSGLDTLITILSKATQSALPGDLSPYQINPQSLLTQRYLSLFGSYPETSAKTVMLTLTTAAANDYALTCGLMHNGMNCARINCAHDNITVWQAIIRNIRRAEIELGQSCRILMDLAGQQLRTGPIRLGPAIHRIKIKKNAYGQMLVPGRMVLINAQFGVDLYNKIDNVQLRVTIPEAVFKRLKIGQCLHFIDARGKSRYLSVESPVAEYAWLVYCDAGSYLVSGCSMQLFQQHPLPDDKPLLSFNLGEFKGRPETIRVFKEDLLLLTANQQAGCPAEYDDKGKQIKPAQNACSIPAAISQLRKGQSVWLDNNKIGAIVEAVYPDRALLKITHARLTGTILKSGKRLYFPDTAWTYRY